MTVENVAAVVGAPPHSITSRIDGFHLERRCRVCRNDTVRAPVNDLLAKGSSYAGILRAIT